MLLAIDQGNTNTLFAVHDTDRWVDQWRTSTEASRTADEYAVWLSQLLGLAGLSLKDLDACVISSVVPQSLFNLRNLSRRYLSVEPMVVGVNVDLGLSEPGENFFSVSTVRRENPIKVPVIRKGVQSAFGHGVHGEGLG